MCYTCYQKMGKPQIVNDKTKKAAELISVVYEYHGAGGALHIVIDDWNLEDDSLVFCKKWIDSEDHKETTEDQRRAERECLAMLEQMTIEERASALAINDGFLC